MRRLQFALSSALFVLAVPASAVTITTDYSSLGTVYQNADGVFSSSAGAGFTDVTDLFKANVSTGISYLQNSILVPFNTTITFQLANLGAGIVGDSEIMTSDVNNRPSSSTIRVNSGDINFFVDPTPLNNVEYMMTNTNAPLGGGMVNVSRFGNAVSSGPAENRVDLLTLAVHEMEHSLGYSDVTTRFTDAAGATEAPNRAIIVPSTLTGLPSDLSLPFVSGSAHIDGVTQGGLFNNTVVADPGFTFSQRALPTGAEIYGLCGVLGCNASQVNPSISAVPEPSEWLMFMAAGPLLLWASRRRRASHA